MYVHIYITHFDLVWLLLDIHVFSTDAAVGTYIHKKKPTCIYKVLQ